MRIRQLTCQRLEVSVYETREEMGMASAVRFAARLRNVLAEWGYAAAVFASAPSQNEFLASLRTGPDIDCSHVTAFHLDEYIGISADHPASFRKYIRDHLIDCVPMGAFHELRGDAPNPEAECRRYEALLKEAAPAVVALGIGENGHLAFIDPPV